MVLKYQISKYPDLMEDLIVKIWEAQSDEPGAEVYTQNLPQAMGGGHPDEVTIIANGLDLVVHVVRLVGAVSGEIFHYYNSEPSRSIATLFDPIRFKIGDGGEFTPDAGTNVYSNPILVGLTGNQYDIHRNNYGFLFPDNHITIDSLTGSFQLTGDDEFGPEEEFYIALKPKFGTTTVNDSVVGKWFAGFIDVAVNMSYDSSHLRKLIRFTGSAEYEFEATVPIGYGFLFQNIDGAGITGRVLFNGGGLKFDNGVVFFIDLPPFSEAAFVYDGAFWNIIYICKSDFILSGLATPGSIVGAGTLLMGNIPNVNINAAVNHNLNIPGDYMVLISLRGTSTTWTQDINVIHGWFHDITVAKKDKFWVSLKDTTAGVQDITICWTIIKL